MIDGNDLYEDATPADYATQVGSDPKAFLGHGWAFPVGVNAGRIATADYEEDIRQAIRIILDTDPGERVMRPDFGCGLRQLVFAPNSDALAAATQTLVHGSLLRWLNEVILVDEVKVEARDETLEVTVGYTRRATGERREDVFRQPMAG